jgi:protease I
MARQIKVACIVGADFEDSEFRVPYDRLRKEGFEVVIIGAQKGKELAGKKGKERIRAEAGIDEVDPSQFDMLFIPGGYSPDHLRADPRFVEFVKAFDHAGKPIAAICHGPQLLMTARLVKGRTLTAWQTVQDDLELAGANVRDEPVVIDRNWITSRKPDDLPRFSEAIAEYLLGRRGAEAGGAPNA